MKQLIFLNHNIVQSGLSEQAFAVYISLLDMINEADDQVYVSLAQIHLKLTGHTMMKRAERDGFLMGLDQLCDEKIISIVEPIGKSEFLVDVSPLKQRYEAHEYYDVVYLDEVRKIMNINDINNLLLLRYFCIAISTFDYQHRIGADSRIMGSQTIDNLAKMCDIHIQSAAKYNRILEANELLFMHHYHVKNKKDGGFKTINSYCRYKNKEFIENLEE